MDADSKLVAYFHKHLVPVLLSLKRDADSKVLVLTSFVLSVRQRWYLVTAGHCLTFVEDLTKLHGFRVDNAQLFDFGGLDAKHMQAIPFDYIGAFSVCLSPLPEFDYGIIELTPNHVRLLQANGVEPLNEEVWDKQPPAVDFHMMLGLPAQYVVKDRTHVSFKTIMMRVDVLPDRPAGFPETAVPLFYGRFSYLDDLQTIEGMSGGPILGFHLNAKGELRYWLIALQSTCLPQSMLVKACPIRPLGRFLDNMIAEEAPQG